MKNPALVNDHDFRSQAEGIAIPYGIYDLLAKHGSVFIGNSRDTPDFATDCLVRWYEKEGWYRYPYAEQILILADCGGSNSYRHRAWKYGLQNKICNHYGLTVTVCHYPPGASKWNPIEHLLFSEISKNWAGRPLDSYETIQNYISTTSTTTGLTVNGYLHSKEYVTGIKITDEQMKTLALKPHELHPKYNYTLKPVRVSLDNRNTLHNIHEGRQKLFCNQKPEVIFA